ESAIDVFRKEGAEVIDPADADSLKDAGEDELNVLLYELKATLNAYLSSLGPKAAVKTLWDIIQFNQRYADKELAFFDQDLLIRAEDKGPLTDRAYVEMVTSIQQVAREQGLDMVMTKNRLDAVIAPTNAPAWITDHAHGDHFTGGSSTPAAVAG